MEVQNTLANRIDTAGNMLSYDEACKQVLANLIILAWILKACVREYKDCSVEEIAAKYIEGEPEISKSTVHVDESAEFITGMNTEDATMKEGTVKFDIKFRAILPETGETVEILINVEIQNDFYPGYPIVKRGIYYASRMISSQYGTVFTKEEYEKIKKVYSIWICPHPPKYRQNTIMSYHMTEEAIQGSVTEKEVNYDLLTVVMVCLGGKDKENYNGLLKMLDVLLSDETGADDKKRILCEEFDIPMTKELEGDVMRMCNLSKGVYERAVDKTLVDSIKKLMNNKGWDIQECMDVLEIPVEKRGAYKAAIMEEPMLV